MTMPRHGKRYRSDLEAHQVDNVLTLDDAIAKVKTFGKSKFDQTIEICLHLGIDAKQADQAVRGAIALPHGIGKTKRVVAFCKPEQVDDCKANGAVEAGGEELVKKIEDGWMEFDVAVASPDMMRVCSKLGRVLGPRGLMPSPKSGTVTPKVVEAVKEYAAGKVEFRNDSGGNVHGVIGKQSFEVQQLKDNATTFIDNIVKMRPTATKGQYIKKITISGTMTPGVQIAQASATAEPATA
jgi:large subunit ribosomal protein L1